MDDRQEYNVPLVAVSVVIAIVAGTAPGGLVIALSP
jgi:hypothetical protein